MKIISVLRACQIDILNSAGAKVFLATCCYNSASFGGIFFFPSHFKSEINDSIL